MKQCPCSFLCFRKAKQAWGKPKKHTVRGKEEEEVDEEEEEEEDEKEASDINAKHAKNQVRKVHIAS